MELFRLFKRWICSCRHVHVLGAFRLRSRASSLTLRWGTTIQRCGSLCAAKSALFSRGKTISGSNSTYFPCPLTNLPSSTRSSKTLMQSCFIPECHPQKPLPMRCLNFRYNSTSATSIPSWKPTAPSGCCAWREEKIRHSSLQVPGMLSINKRQASTDALKCCRASSMYIDAKPIDSLFCQAYKRALRATVVLHSTASMPPFW